MEPLWNQHGQYYQVIKVNLCVDLVQGSFSVFRARFSHKYIEVANLISGIISYMENQFGPSSKLKPTLKDVKDFTKDATDDLLILGVFKGEDDPLYVTFLEANNDLREEYTFGHTFDKQAMGYFGLKESSVIVVHPRHLVSQYEPKYPAFKVLVFSEFLL